MHLSRGFPKRNNLLTQKKKKEKLKGPPASNGHCTNMPHHHNSISFILLPFLNKIDVSPEYHLSTK